MPAFDGDVEGAGNSVKANGRGSQGGAWCGPDLGMVFGKDDVADPVQPVLDAPVPADHLAIYRRGSGRAMLVIA
jgi:hypothetical protein